MEELVEIGSWLSDVEKAVSRFDCGEKSINDYLKENAREKGIPHRLILLTLEEQILGFVAFSISNYKISIQSMTRFETDPVLYIEALGVDKDFQRQKIGSQLLSGAMKTALSIDILAPLKGVMLSSLLDATDFYEKFDFQYLGSRPEKAIGKESFLMFTSISQIDDMGLTPYYQPYTLSD